MIDQKRMPWADIARGAAVLAVVLLHVTYVTYSGFVQSDELRTAWESIITATWPFHLTTLFVVSGLLNSGKVRDGFRSPKLRRTLALTVYLYLLWQAIYFVLSSFGYNLWSPSIYTKKLAVLQILLPVNVLWFLLGLVVWMAVLAALRRVPWWVMLPALGALSIASWWMPGQRGHDHYLDILTYGVFFAIGVYGRTLITRLVEARALALFAGGLVSFIGSRLAEAVWPSIATGAVSQLFWLGGAAAMLLAASHSASLLPRGFDWLRRIGTKTLPIYVLHHPIAAVIAVAPTWGAFINNPGFVYIAPAVIAAAVALAALGIDRLLAPTPLRYLFELPTKRPVTTARR